MSKSEPSTIGFSDKLTNTTTRRSQSAILPDVLDKNVSDPVAESILKRASAIQGHAPMSHTEPLQLVKYQTGEYYRAHYDAWKSNDPATEGNRETSFFVIMRSEGLLDSDMPEGKDSAPTAVRVNSGTSFSRLRRRFVHDRLCEAVECGEVEGIVAKPVALSVFFWLNLMENGKVRPGSLHQGLELPQGPEEKIGMNIWTWNRPYLG
ncbi:hypothetical protein FJTKL_13008 [Diaporthe vaccinii]|uniref:Prolyl 4-hydroxylase alpha subunit domain-containing protein n=1 Tax=Diaporthe vaccinii TaxID=105482 RepID=A0ABR4ECD3_9PEZI